MKINFECKTCHRIFDGDVGKIDFPPEEDYPRFERQPMCPKCGVRTHQQVFLTEKGQGQMTDAFMDF